MRTPEEREDARAGYAAAIQLLVYARQAHWTRVNVLLLVNSILLLAVVTALSGEPSRPHRLAAGALCLAGAILTWVWGRRVARSDRRLADHWQSAMVLERQLVGVDTVRTAYRLYEDVGGGRRWGGARAVWRAVRQGARRLVRREVRFDVHWGAAATTVLVFLLAYALIALAALGPIVAPQGPGRPGDHRPDHAVPASPATGGGGW